MALVKSNRLIVKRLVRLENIKPSYLTGLYFHPEEIAENQLALLAHMLSSNFSFIGLLLITLFFPLEKYDLLILNLSLSVPTLAGVSVTAIPLK